MEKGISILRQGGIVAYPTDTVYGLGASMTNHRAVERIYRVKQRPPDMALPLIGFGAFDLAFAAVTAIAIRRSGIDWRNW